MARDTYNVTVQLVLDDVGGADVSRITATSKHVNTGNVQTWINRGAGRLNGIVAAEKLTVTTDQARDYMHMIVIEYAKARLYERLNRHEAKDSALEEWRRLLDELRLLAEEVHEGSTDSGRVQSNISTADPKKRKFVSYNEDREDGFRGW